METIKFSFQERTMRVHKSGSGSEIMLLFHGFGQNGEVFRGWHDTLEKTHTLYSFDLFFHGESDQTEAPVTISYWGELIQTFAERQQLDRFHLTGFSLGGRFVNATVISLPDRVKSITYIAPDGFYESPWQTLALSFKSIFKYVMTHPEALIKLADAAEKYRLSSPSLIKFAKRELRDIDNRVRVYRSWVFLKPLIRNHRKVTRTINDHDIKCTLVLGSKDHIIPPKKVNPKFKPAPDALICVIEKRHHEMIDAALALLYSKVEFD